MTNIFLDNKYTRIYYRIINAAKIRTPEGYVEKHHILPKSLGGTNKSDNLVSLTAREHYVVHRLLPKMTEGAARQKMALAAWTMARTRKIKINSRTYATLREDAAQVMSVIQKGKKTGPKSEAHKQKLREAAIRRYQDPEQRRLAAEQSTGRTHTAESKAKMSAAKQGYKPSVTGGMKGRKHSPSTIEKMKSAWNERRSGSC